MPTLYLKCRDKRYAKGEWRLSLKDNGVTLTDSEDELQAKFSRKKAESRFVFPSFWDSKTDLSIEIDNGDLVSFSPNKENIKGIKAYLQGALAAKGPGAVAKVRTKGWLLVGGGIALALLGIVLTVLSINSDRGTIVFYGAVLAGCAIVAQGVNVLIHAGRAGRRLDEDEDEEPEERERPRSRRRQRDELDEHRDREDESDDAIPEAEELPPAEDVIVRCSSCEKKLKIPARSSGKKVKCPRCGAVVVAD